MTPSRWVSRRWLLLFTVLVVGFASRLWAQNALASANSPSAQIQAGEGLYLQHCALCHGAKGRDATVFPRPIWGPGHELAKFQHARGLFEYLQSLMPFDDPTKLDDTAKIAITA